MFVEFVAGDDALAFVARYRREDFFGADFNNRAFDDFTGGKARLAFCDKKLLPL